VKGLFVISITAAIMGWLAAQASRAKARRLGHNLLFPPVRAVYVIFFLVLAMATAFVFFGLRGPENDRTIVVSGGILFIIFPAVVWPKAVHVSASGPRQRSWWGGWKTLSWAQISEAKERRDGCIILRGNGVKIVFSPYHAGRQLFLEEIGKHTSVKLTLKSGSPTYSRSAKKGARARSSNPLSKDQNREGRGNPIVS